MNLLGKCKDKKLVREVRYLESVHGITRVFLGNGERFHHKNGFKVIVHPSESGHFIELKCFVSGGQYPVRIYTTNSSFPDVLTVINKRYV